MTYSPIILTVTRTRARIDRLYCLLIGARCDKYSRAENLQ